MHNKLGLLKRENNTRKSQALSIELCNPKVCVKWMQNAQMTRHRNCCAIPASNYHLHYFSIASLFFVQGSRREKIPLFRDVIFPIAQSTVPEHSRRFYAALEVSSLATLQASARVSDYLLPLHNYIHRSQFWYRLSGPYCFWREML